MKRSHLALTLALLPLTTHAESIDTDEALQAPALVITSGRVAEPKKAAIAAATGVLTRESGEVAEVQKWGKKRLAYGIKKRREGHYVYLRLQGPPRAVMELERHLNIAEPVLKFLTVLMQAPRRKVGKAKTPAAAAAEAQEA